MFREPYKSNPGATGKLGTMENGEWTLIDRIRKSVDHDPRVLTGIGDDTAVLVPAEQPQLVTVDMLLEGVHFDLSQCSPYDVGWKAMAVNLSDIAAMAGTPTAAVVAVALPKGRPAELPQELFRGLKAAADAYDTSLVGGDTNFSPGGLVIAVTLLGTAHRKGPVLRSGARPGDWLCVTGKLGYSLAGHHYRFQPRVREAQRLADRYELHAMLDLSDGLASDLFHLTDESDCGCVVIAEQIPVNVAMIQDDRTPLDHALNDGEDFELLFTLAASDAERLIAEQPLAELGIDVTHLGTITSEKSVWLEIDGERSPFPRGGFQHRW